MLCIGCKAGVNHLAPEFSFKF